MSGAEAPRPASSLAARRYGYDIFLSFALGVPPRGTQSYASDLSRRLRERDFTVFFSEEVMPPGGQLGPALTAALANSRSLVLIANRETLRAPRWLKTEVETFRKLHGDRPVIVVNIDGALQDPELGPAAQDWLEWENRIWVDETAQALDSGIASSSTVERLALAPISARSNRRWRQLTIGVIAGLLILAVALGAAALIAVERDTRARASLRSAVALKLASEGQALLDGSQPGGDEQGLQRLVAAARLEPDHPSISANLNQALQDRSSLVKLVTTEDMLTTVAVSPDGRLIATGDFGGHIRLWEAGSLNPSVRAFQAHKDRVASLAFTPDSKALVSAGPDGLRLWSTDDGRRLSESAPKYTDQVWSVAYSRDGMLLASGGADGQIRLWNAKTGAAVGEPLSHGAAVYCLAFGADGMLASGGQDDTIRLWNVRNGPAPVHVLRGHIQDVWSLAFSPDGRTLVSGGGDWTVRFWDVITGQPRSDPPVTLHKDKVWAVAFHPSEARVVSASLDGSVRMWDAVNGTSPDEPLRGHSDGIRGVSFSADGRQIVSASHDRGLRLWTSTSTRALRKVLPEPGERDFQSSFFYGDRRFTATQDSSTLRIWHARRNRRVDLPLQGPPDSVYSVAFSADGRSVAAGGKSGRVRRWDTESGAPLGSPIQAHEGEITALAFSADGSVLASSGEDRMLRLWDARSGKPREPVFPRQDKPVRQLAFSPDGRQLVSSGDQFLRRWDARTGAPLDKPPLPSHDDRVSQLTFSLDGRLLASGGEDFTVRIWDARTGRQLLSPLIGHKGGITSLAFSADGRLLTSGGGDGLLLLWDSATGAPIGPVIDRQSHVQGLLFSVDGRSIAGHGGETKGANEWLAPPAWPDTLCSKLSRNASRKAWDNWAGTELNYVVACPGLPVAPDDEVAMPYRRFHRD